jgi:circadian clock protein KaiB
MPDREQNSSPRETHTGPAARYELTLYVAGLDEPSRQMASTVQTICDDMLAPENWNFDLVDISDKPDVARRQQIVAVPLLVVRTGAYTRRIIGQANSYERLRNLLALCRECDERTQQAGLMTQQAQQMMQQAMRMREEAQRMLGHDAFGDDRKDA